MASVWRHPKSPFWTACFTDGQGKQRKRSTKETDRRKALKMAEMLEGEYRKVRTSNQMQQILVDVHREVTGEKIAQATLADYQPQWLAGKKAEGCADASYAFYRHSTERFVKFMGDAASKPIASITRADVERFRNSLTGVLAPKTVGHQIKGLRMLFKAAHEAKLMDSNPAAAVKTAAPKAGTKKLKRAFLLPEIRRIIPHCVDYWEGLVLLGLYTGQRLADVQNLTWADISADLGTITLTARKTGRRMTIPTAEPLRAYLAGLDRPQDHASFVHPNAAAVKSNTLSGRFLDILVAAGLRQRSKPGTARDHSLLSFHSLRHSTVTLLKEAGIPQAVVMELVGHSSEAMSAHYTKVGEDALGKAAAALPAL